MPIPSPRQTQTLSVIEPALPFLDPVLHLFHPLKSQNTLVTVETSQPLPNTQISPQDLPENIPTPLLTPKISPRDLPEPCPVVIEPVLSFLSAALHLCHPMKRMKDSCDCRKLPTPPPHPNLVPETYPSLVQL